MKSELIHEFQTELNKYELSPNELFLLYAIVYSKEYPKGVNENLYKALLWKKGWLNAKWEPTEKIKIIFDKLPDADFDRNVITYQLMFPAGNLPHGKRARSEIRELKEKFKWFFKNYNYDWPTIHEATERYITHYSESNFMFMRTASYFIYKQLVPTTKTSDLAEWCDKVLSKEEPEHGFDINV